MPQLDVTSFSSQIFWLLCFFIFLYFVISRYVAPNITSIISERNFIVEDNISMTEQYNDQIKAIEEYQDSLKSELNASIEEASLAYKKIFNEEYKKNRSSLEEKIAKKQQVAQLEINNYVNNFRAHEAPYCISLAEFIIEKVTDKKADKDILEKIYKQII